MKKFLLFTMITAMVLTLFACGKQQVSKEQNQQKEKEFTLTYTVKPNSLDPAQAVDILEQMIINQVSEPLIKYDYKTMEPITGVAKSWDIKDGKTYTFEIREDVQFSNGRNCTAEDVKYSFERILTPDSQVSYLLEPVLGAKDKIEGKASETAGIKVTGKYSIEITLEKPNYNFLSAIGSPNLVIIDKNEVEAQGKDYGAKLISGIGAFRLLSRDDNSIVLTRNDKYYSKKANVDRFKILILEHEPSWEEYKAGKIDFLFFVPNVKSILNDTQYKERIKTIPNLATQSILLNIRKEPFKSNLKLRQAVSYAINKQQICDAVLDDNSGVPANIVTHPLFYKYDDPEKMFSYDMEKAKKLLEEAGYPGGKGLPKLKLTYFNRGPQKKMLEAVKKDLEMINIEAELIEMDPEKVKSIYAFDENITDIYREGFGPDYLDVYSYIQPLFHSSGYMNYVQYRNDKVDQLMEKSILTKDFAERKNLLMQAELEAMKDYVRIPIHWYQLTTISSPRVKNLEISPMGFPSIENVVIED